MARYLGLLMIAPCLAVLGWLYWLYVRRLAANGVRARFDAGVLVVATAAAAIGSASAYQLALDHAGPIWKQVAAPVGAYLCFNAVLFAGLLRHWASAGPGRSARPTPVNRGASATGPVVSLSVGSAATGADGSGSPDQPAARTRAPARHMDASPPL
ncbi:MAG: hypothetical protein ACREP0_04550 [Rhodanobacteraceae bacterium]